MSLTVFQLRTEGCTRIHLGGLLSQPDGMPKDSFRLEAIAPGCRVEIKHGGHLELPTQDRASLEHNRFVDVFIEPSGRKPFHVSFQIVDSERNASPCNLSFIARAPLSEKNRSSYFRESGWLFRSEPPNAFSVRPASLLRHAAWELRYDAWLLFRQPSRRAKLAIPVRWIALCLRPWMRKRRYWLVMDRITMADDNGLAMFRYLIAHQPEIGCRPRFVLHRESREWREVRKIGPVLPYSGFRYRFATLFAEWIIASPSLWQVVHPLNAIPDGYRGLANDLQLAFLQHGIIKDDLSNYLNRSVLGCDLFVTSAKRERDSIVTTPAYGYHGNNVVLTGMPRHDLLENHREKSVVFMPTWRESLISGWNPRTGKSLPRETFTDSDYFRHLHSVLSSQRLLDAASRLGYAIEFFPHPEIQPLAPLFTDDQRVRILPPGTKYRDVFAHGALCVTDYSSAVFDFAWLGKPVVYYQPDDDNHYAKGYFDYEQDGFGPATHSADKLVDILIALMERDCPMDEPYRSRAKHFFAFHDKNNCRRVTDAILAAGVH